MVLCTRRWSKKENTRNEFVAFKDRKVLDNYIKLERLVKKLNLTNYDESIAIEFV